MRYLMCHSPHTLTDTNTSTDSCDPSHIMSLRWTTTVTTKYKTRTVTCTPPKPTLPLFPAHELQAYSHYEIPDKNRDMHSAETRVTFSDDHYEIQDQNRHIHSAGYISTQWPPASARMN